MKLLLVYLIFLFLNSCSTELLFFPSDEFYPRDDILFECPEACPAESVPICTSNGFCIKLFDSPCQVLYYNCKNNEEYKQIHQEYCVVPRFKNLQPTACLNNTITSNNNTITKI